MSEEITKETKDDEKKGLGELMDSPGVGRPKGSKNKEAQPISKDDKFELLIEEILELKKDLQETKGKLDKTEKMFSDRPSVTTRLMTSKKAALKVPKWYVSYKEGKEDIKEYDGPLMKIKFFNVDQPKNSQVFKWRTKEIDWQQRLHPGKVDEIPAICFDYINSRTEPEYGEVQDPKNPRQTFTRQTGEKQRCYCIPA